MTVRVLPMPADEVAQVAAPLPEAGAGAFVTDRGNLPLDLIDVRAAITGLVVRTEVVQGFRNPYDVPLEATYIFPLPDRGSVTAMRMEAADRIVEAELAERGEARERYDAAITAGQRASIAEQERADVFTMRVGNILPGERVTIRLTLAGALPYEDGKATYRFPLVVAPRYVPGLPLPGGSVGDGVSADTDAVPDASRITPPVLLPGFPNPVRLGIEVDVDPAGLPLETVRSSLHTVTVGASDDSGPASVRVRALPGERADRDFVLRIAYGATDADTAAGARDAPEAAPATLVLARDSEESEEGTFQLTVLPPASVEPPRPRDVVIALDRSGSMAGWKMVAARRAAARIVDTLTSDDRFAVLTFDHEVQHPADLPAGLVAATDRHRYRAVEHLARMDSRGGTEMLAPLQQATTLLTATDRDRVLVLVTDGQVGNEHQILQALADPLREVRVHVVGIDKAVNAGFLGQLAALGGGRCELVESEERLDEATERIHRRVAAPVATGLRLETDGLELIPDTVAPRRLPSLFPGVPLVVMGRWRGQPAGEVSVIGTTRAGDPWRVSARGTVSDAAALTAIWARAHLRELEDQYVVRTTEWRGNHDETTSLERRIVATSLRFGVLCRFTAFLAVDSRIVTDGAEPRRVTQPVEMPAGWETDALDATMTGGMAAAGPAPFGQATLAAESFAMSPNLVPAAAPPPMAAPGGPPPAPPLAPSGPPPAQPLARGGGGPRARAGRKMARGDESTAMPDPIANAQRQLADELKRLHANAAADVVERWEMLADLASRLETLLQHLTGAGASSAQRPEVAALRGLVKALAVCDGAPPPDRATLDALWQQAVVTLESISTGAEPAAPPRRAQFWKR